MRVTDVAKSKKRSFPKLTKFLSYLRSHLKVWLMFEAPGCYRYTTIMFVDNLTDGSAAWAAESAPIMADLGWQRSWKSNINTVCVTLSSVQEYCSWRQQCLKKLNYFESIKDKLVLEWSQFAMWIERKKAYFLIVDLILQRIHNELTKFVLDCFLRTLAI